MELEFKTYHYGDNNLDDSGWGCSYRNIQTILSYYKKYIDNTIDIPDIRNIIFFFNKTLETSNKKELWIEPYDISLYLSSLFKIKGNHYVFVSNDYDFSKILKTDLSFYFENNRIITSFDKMLSILKNYFSNYSIPCVIDDGIYSYCLIMENNEIILIDPHRTENKILKKNTGFLKNKFFMYYFPIIDKA